MAKLRVLATLTLLAVLGSRAEAGLFDFLFGGPVKPEFEATFSTDVFDDGGAEIVTYDAKSKLFLVTNAADNTLDVLQLDTDASPSNLVRLHQVDLSPYGAGPNSVAVDDGLAAVAVENDDKQANGSVVFFDLCEVTDEDAPVFVADVEVGALPDMVTFTPDGDHVLVANEGEPNDDYTVDPVGSVSIIDVDDLDAVPTTLVLGAGPAIGPNVRIFGPGADAAKDLEPEYITVSKDSKRAFVACQENNALATIDLESMQVVGVRSFLYKDHSKEENALDASNRDDGINITTWPVLGMYQPDAIASTSLFGFVDIVWTANEGDARDYDGFSEEARAGDSEYVLDPTAFPNADDLKLDENLGRLNVTTTLGDTDNDGDFDEIYCYGGRSFSAFAVIGGLPIPIYDSGSDFEDITATELPDDFNSTNDENDSFDNRSDDKGPEPEAIAIGKVGFRQYAFVGLERVGGIMTYEITNPFRPSFVDYVNNRDFAGDADAGTAGDLGPEGIVFVPGSESPIPGTPLIAVANEVSGTTTVYTLGGSGGLLSLLFPGLF